MARQNYFNTLSMAGKLDQLGQCRFMGRHEFSGVERLKGKKVVTPATTASRWARTKT